MKRMFLLILFAVCLSIFCGCESSPPSSSSSSSLAGQFPKGFLSDYSKLKQMSDTSYRYMNRNINMSDYDKFIVDPVKMLFSYGPDSDVKSWEELENLRTYMWNAIVDAVNADYLVVQNPGPGVARVRTALTGVKRASAFSKGGASVEIEIVDSQTGEQLAALVESKQEGGPLGEYYGWENAKKIMNGWGQRVRQRLEQAAGEE